MALQRPQRKPGERLKELNELIERNHWNPRFKRHDKAVGLVSRLTSRAIQTILNTLTVLLVLTPVELNAQFDLIVFEKRPPQAKSREELTAVLDIVQATDEKTIVSLCKEFQKKFPASELAGQVHRMEMHAYGRLNEYGKMIEAGEKSLERSAHDVDALLSLANAIPNGVSDLTPASVALLDKAEGYARKALEEIDRIKATRGVSIERWRQLTSRMRSSAQEALGFVAFKRGNYTESVAALEKSIGLNPEAGGVVFFRLGIAYLYDGKWLEAQVALERSAQLGPELIRQKAQEQLARFGIQSSSSNPK
jgi:tetratricopeptide (TPR) repeat protein